jgi:hypothetical protein
LKSAAERKKRFAIFLLFQRGALSTLPEGFSLEGVSEAYWFFESLTVLRFDFSVLLPGLELPEYEYSFDSLPWAEVSAALSGTGSGPEFPSLGHKKGALA